MTTKEEVRRKIYQSYRKNHNDLLYGRTTIKRIESQFRVWDYYYHSHFPPNKQARILDIGCGEGGFVHYLIQSGYTHVSGIDLSKEQIDLGNELGIKGLVQGDLREFLAKEGRFDFIIARDVVEHFTKEEAFELVSLVFSSLNEGGKFLMQVPNGEGIFMSSIYFGDFTHETLFSQLSIRQLFLTIGFKGIKSYPTGPVPLGLKGRLRKGLWSLRVLAHRFWKMIETGNPGGIFTSNIIAVGEK